MPDDPPVTQGGTQQGNPLNIQSDNATINVTRMDIATGAVKDIQSELLSQVCACIDAQTKTLADKLEDIKGSGGGSGGGGSGDNEIAKALQAMTVQIQHMGGGDGESSTTRAGFASIEAAGDAHKALTDILKKEYPAIEKWGQLFSKGVMLQFKNNMRDLNEQVFQTAQNMGRMRPAIQQVWQQTKKLYEQSQTGLIEISAIYEDLGSTLVKNRLSMQETTEVIEKMRDSGNLLVGTLGNNAEQVAKSLFDAETTIKEAFGGEVLGRARRGETVEVLSQILDQQRRSGVMATNEEILSGESTRKQLATLDLIAGFTGQTRDAIMKLHEEERRSLAELQFNNVITKDQRLALERNLQIMKGAGMGAMGDLLKGFVEKGGVEGGLRLAMQDPSVAKLMTQGNNEELTQRILNILGDNTKTGASAVQEIQALTARMTGLQGGPQSGGRMRELFPGLGSMSSAIQDAVAREMAGADLEKIEANLNKRNKTQGEATKAINEVLDGLKSNFGETGPLIIAVLANTAALLVNAALMGGKGVMKLFRGAGGMALETTAQASARVAAQQAAQQAAKTTASTAARTGLASAGRFGLAALGSTAAVGAAGWLGWEIGKALAPRIDSAVADATGVEGATLGTTDAAASFFEAFGLGHQEDEKQKAFVKQQMQNVINAAAERRRKKREAAAKGVSPTKGVNPDIADSATVAPADAEGKKPKVTSPDDPMLVQLLSQNKHLTNIVTLLTTANTIGTDIIDTMGGSSTTSNNVAPATSRQRRNASLFSDTQSAGTG